MLFFSQFIRAVYQQIIGNDMRISITYFKFYESIIGKLNKTGNGFMESEIRISILKIPESLRKFQILI